MCGWVGVFSYSVMSDSLRPHGLNSLWNSPGQDTGVGSFSLHQGIFPTQVSHIAGGFFASWATGKPKNIGVGCLLLLQGIFPTQESNWGLLHCRRVLYQLSYQGSPWRSYCRSEAVLGPRIFRHEYDSVLPLSSEGKTKLQLLLSILSEGKIYYGNREKHPTNSPSRNPKQTWYKKWHKKLGYVRWIWVFQV